MIRDGLVSLKIPSKRAQHLKPLQLERHYHGEISAKGPPAEPLALAVCDVEVRPAGASSTELATTDKCALGSARRGSLVKRGIWEQDCTNHTLQILENSRLRGRYPLGDGVVHPAGEKTVILSGKCYPSPLGAWRERVGKRRANSDVAVMIDSHTAVGEQGYRIEVGGGIVEFSRGLQTQ